MKVRLVIAGTVLAVGLLAAWALRQTPVRADSYTYSAQKREIKVCNLLIDSFAVPGSQPLYNRLENPDPYVFYVLDARTDLKPRGWELVNPLAPREVTPRIRDRWAFLEPGHPYTVGQRVTKNMACYWEVYLGETAIEDLLQFDLIFLTSHSSDVRFTAEDSEALRKLVDLGGTLWLEDCWLMRINPAYPFFIPELNFRGDSLAGYNNRPAHTGIIMDRYHPILNAPYRLTEEEINRLGDKNVDDYRLTSLDGGSPPDPLLFPIVNNGGDYGGGAGRFPYIAGGRYGNGLILATAGDTGCDINDWIQEPPAATIDPSGQGRPDRNGGAFCGPDIQRAPAEDLKFMYNVLNWAHGESNYRRGPRRSGYSREEVGAPLDVAWKVPLPDGVRIVTAPVIWRDIAFFSADNGWVYAVDTRPQEDRDGDGNPNDGIQEGVPNVQDLTPASPYDIVWTYQVGTVTSAMFVATVNVGGQPVDVLFFSTPSVGNQPGRLWALYAMPGGRTLASTTATLWNPVPIGSGLCAPVVNRGRLMVLGRDDSQATKQYNLWFVNPANGQSPFPWDPVNAPRAVPVGGTPDTTEPDLLAPVTASLIRDERTGATVDVAYASLPTGQLDAVALEVTGEVAEFLRYEPPGSNPPQYTVVRLKHAWVRQDPYKPRVRVYNGGALVGTPALAPDAQQPAAVRELALVGDIRRDLRIVVDYPVDVPNNPDIHSKRVTITLPGYVSGSAASGRPAAGSEWAPVLSGVALGLDDTSYLASGSGMVQAVAERNGDGTVPQSASKVLWRYNLNEYAQQPNPLPAGTKPTYYERAANHGTWVAGRFDPVHNAWVPLPPAVTDKMTYVAMNRYDTTTTPPTLIEGAVFAFDNQAVFAIDLQAPPSGDPNDALTAAQIGPGTVISQYCPEGTATDAVDSADPAQNWKVIPRGFWQVDAANQRIIFKAFGSALAICPTLPLWVENYVPKTPPNPGDPPPPPLPFYLGSPRPVLIQQPNGQWVSVDRIDPQGNLVWRYPDPGYYPNPAGLPVSLRQRVRWESGVTSPPSVSGDVVYVGTGDGRVFALDADPRDGGVGGGITRVVDDGLDDWEAVLLKDPTDTSAYPFDPNLRMPQTWPQGPGWPTRMPPDVIWVGPGATPDGVVNPSPLVGVPGGATTASNLVCVPVNLPDAASGNVFGTLFGFSQSVYALADANRVLHVDVEGRVLWSLHETMKRVQSNYSTVPADDVPYGTPPAQTFVEQKPLNRPQSAQALSADTMLVADTGNNRVVLLDRSGSVVWEATEIYDPFSLLQAGEFTIGTGYGGEQNMRVSRLSSPMDATQWVSYEPNPSDNTKWVTVRHTLIADTGNTRVIEIVDKWQPGTPGYLPRQDGGYWYHVVVWASQTNVGHKDPWGRFQPAQRYRYTSVQPVSFCRRYTEDLPSYTGLGSYTEKVLCTVSNYALSWVNGARRQTPGASLVLLSENLPRGGSQNPDGQDAGKAYVWDAPGDPGYASTIATPSGGTRAMSQPALVRRFRYAWGTGGEVYHCLYADATGIYEWVETAAGVLPLDANGRIDAARMYRQFWRETYQALMKELEVAIENTQGINLVPDPNQPGVDFRPESYQFQPGSVTIDPNGGWLIANRVLDRALSSMLRQAYGDDRARRIQVFWLNSNPRSETMPGARGDYDPSAPNFGFTPNSIVFRFGPQVRSLGSGRGLVMDLVDPVYAVRAQ